MDIYKLSYWNLLKFFVSVWKLHGYTVAKGYVKYAWACGRIRK